MLVAPPLESSLSCRVAVNLKEVEQPWHHPLKHKLLQEVVESFIDGILILSASGEWVHGNDCARRLCAQMTQCTAPFPLVPRDIWRVCELLMKSRDLPHPPLVVESEIETSSLASLRLRVRWLEAIAPSDPLLLVTLEDRQQSIRQRAIAEIQKYHLTPREAEVWLLHQHGYAYKDIAARLYITVNTVKRHMKSIHAKRKELADGLAS